MGGVLACARLTPCVDPLVRQLAVGHNLALRRYDDTVANKQTQLDDGVATVQSRQGIVINACIVYVTLFRLVVLAFKEMPVKLNRVTVADGIDDLRVILLLVINYQIIEMVVELIRQMHR